jgi:hypothetical protein
MIDANFRAVICGRNIRGRGLARPVQRLACPVELRLDQTMVRWFLPILFFAALGAFTSARAEDKISAEVSSNTVDGVTTTSVVYAYADCEEECHIATLTCTGNSITMVLGDVAAADVAKAIVQDTKQIAFTANGKTYDYSISDMQFAELTGSWWLTAHEQGSAPAEISTAVAASKTVEAVVGVKSVVLPVDKAVKDWAIACK